MGDSLRALILAGQKFAQRLMRLHMIVIQFQRTVFNLPEDRQRQKRPGPHK